MALAVSLTFDEETDRAVREIWRALAKAGVCHFMQELNYAPHLSMLVSDDDDAEPALTAAVQGVLGTRSFEVDLGPVRRFPETEICWLACDGGDAVARLHALVAGVLPLEAIRSHYRPGQWMPHVTLQMVGDVGSGMQMAKALWPKARRAKVTGVELVRFMPVRLLSRVDLH